MVLVVVEIKFTAAESFKYIFWLSLLSLFVAFPGAGLLAFRGQPKSGLIAAAASLVLTPVFIVLGVVLVWWFKVAIGGHRY